MYTVGFLTLGCKVNAYETNGMERLFREAGYEIREFTEPADAYVINTCTVTNIADRKSRQMLHRAKKINPDAVIAAVGCYVQASREEVEKEETIDLVIGNGQKGRVVELITKCLDDKKAQKKIEKTIMVASMESLQAYEELPVKDAGDKSRAYIKVQDGCNQFCTYCIIPYVRGRIRSRREEDIIQEIEGLVNRGYREAVLTGIHLSSYGVEGTGDFMSLAGQPLLALIQKVAAIDGLCRIRLGSLEPRVMTKQFVSGLAQVTKVCPHFHLSLQSGCDTVLNRMNRKYTTAEYEKGVGLLREYFVHPAITTDIITGFPGENPEEFRATYHFMEKIHFSDVHIFKYSRRKGTQADRMADQVPEAVKAERSNRLIELGKQQEREFIESLLGSRETLLVEEKIKIDGRDYFLGRTSRYVKVIVPAETMETVESEVLTVQLTCILKNGLLLALKK